MSDEDDRILNDFPWPAAGDALFEHPLPQSNAALSDASLLQFFFWNTPYLYRQAYYEAGQLLARHLWDGGPHYLIYPMLYCFRHFLELSTKSLIDAYAKYLEQSPKFDTTNEHGLMKLWNEAVRLIEITHENDPRDEDDTLKNVARCMNEFNQVDRSSQTFRYATNKNGQPVINVPELSLSQFARTMESLHSFFDGCLAQVSDWQECKDDMATHLRDESY